MMKHVDALLFRPGPVVLAVELRHVSSVLAMEEARGLSCLDPRRWLGIESKEARKDARVGLLDLPGPPTVLYLGELLGAHEVRARDVLGLAPWLSAKLPPILRPGCLWVDEKVVWLLDLDTLKEHGST
jgi:chemotaxis signal transduction protein